MSGISDGTDLTERWKRHHLRQLASPAEERSDPSPLLLTLPALLKLDELWREVSGFKAQQRVELFSRYCLFVANELRFVSAHALLVAHDLLLGKRPGVDYVFKLLKFKQKGDERFRALRGAAWDLLFILVPELASGGEIEVPVGNETALVTADRALPDLRTRLALGAVIDLGHSKRGLVSMDSELDPRLESHRPAIGDALGLVERSVYLRCGGGMGDEDLDRLQYWTRRLASRASTG